ncbi:bifunctional biotin--[acetyl-CoA-carboxylase] ligase/biotin operon repressor BirA [Methylomonas koyamae]|uniref:bifunctional biotin--[acetyl-CoA-carboxylase] ligase/biotin operon repressor BirA n=1 Tax=Methylomonas koyamae TaxID=702114 RepID=UPI00112BB56C|nr:bifunctional biotin--[acetyl-CoA-carboxylase] ligase/biotin operon repressor BirA [Methylomonas koyamae]TPQ29673.1 bifunctional biotin--[acetyl-CoA-carboxylase] synthetase/biotin operon repressor [Methylomonas koyamae]
MSKSGNGAADGATPLAPKLKQLIGLLGDGRFHSGTELAQSLGISRSAVWKYQQALADAGVDLLAVSGKGYRLNQPLQLLQEGQILEYLTQDASALLRRIEIHDRIQSTNGRLLELARESGESGVVCLAEQQTAGRGRRGRKWISPFGHNVYLSILWRFQGGPAVLSGLSLAMGVAVVRALRALGVEEVGLKWPNDIYWRQRKLAGILIEVGGESGGPCHAVMGLGLNVFMPGRDAAEIDQAWVDLHRILADGAHGMRNRLTAELLNHLLPALAAFESRTLAYWLAEWRSYDCMLQRPVCVFLGEQRFSGEAAGIDDQGLLLLRQADGEIRAFASGEVSLRQS